MRTAPTENLYYATFHKQRTPKSYRKRLYKEDTGRLTFFLYTSEETNPCTDTMAIYILIGTECSYDDYYSKLAYPLFLCLVKQTTDLKQEKDW